jgi:RNA polymerase sigma-70 factor (ECF subfamily)
MSADLHGCLRGDKRAWDAFVDRWTPVIFAAVSRTVGRGTERRQDEVEDVVQDVFVRLLHEGRRLLRSYDPARASLVTWLTIVARSTALDHLRKRRPETANIEFVDPPAPAPPDAAAVEFPPHLLTERQRLVLHLAFDKQMSVEEIARLLGVDAQTVRSTRHKAIQRLREYFGTG